MIRGENKIITIIINKRGSGILVKTGEGVWGRRKFKGGGNFAEKKIKERERERENEYQINSFILDLFES